MSSSSPRPSGTAARRAARGSAGAAAFDNFRLDQTEFLIPSGLIPGTCVASRDRSFNRWSGWGRNLFLGQVRIRKCWLHYSRSCIFNRNRNRSFPDSATFYEVSNGTGRFIKALEGFILPGVKEFPPSS